MSSIHRVDNRRRIVSSVQYRKFQHYNKYIQLNIGK